MRRGIHYDIGTCTRGQAAASSRESFDPAVVRRAMAVIRQELHCTAVRISGQDLGRLAIAAEFALEQGLNAFLARAADAIREHFRGRLTYASGTWENVDWRPSSRTPTRTDPGRLIRGSRGSRKLPSMHCRGFTNNRHTRIQSFARGMIQK